MLPDERELLMQDSRIQAAKDCQRMFGWPKDWPSRAGAYMQTVEKFAKQQMRDTCLFLLGENPAEAVPKRK